MTCTQPDCRRKPKADSRLCDAHWSALVDRVIRGIAAAPPRPDAT